MLALKPTVTEFMADLEALLEKNKNTDLSTWIVCQDESEVSFSKGDDVIHVVIEDDGFNTVFQRLNDNHELEEINSQVLSFEKVGDHFSMTFTVSFFLYLVDRRYIK